MTEARLEVKISCVALDWYSINEYQPQKKHVKGASTIYFDKKDYWTSFRLVMVMGKGLSFALQRKHLIRAACALEALGFVEEAWICACLVKKEVMRLHRKRRIQDSELLKLFAGRLDPRRNVKFELDDISCTIIPMIHTFYFWEPFGCRTVHLALCEGLRTVGWWEEFDKMVEAGLKVWPKNEGLNKLKVEREEMLSTLSSFNAVIGSIFHPLAIQTSSKEVPYMLSVENADASKHQNNTTDTRIIKKKGRIHNAKTENNIDDRRHRITATSISDADKYDADKYITYYDFLNTSPSNLNDLLAKLSHRMHHILLDPRKLSKDITSAIQTPKRPTKENQPASPNPRCCFRISVHQVPPLLNTHQPTPSHPSNRITPTSAKLTLLEVFAHKIIYGIHGMCFLARDKYNDELILVLLENPPKPIQDYDDPVDFIAEIRKVCPRNMIITIIEPYYEIDSCGRKIIRVSNPNYMITMKDLTLNELASIDIELRDQVKVRARYSLGALDWYERCDYTNAIGVAITGYKTFMNSFGETLAAFVTKASYIYFDKKDYWTSFRIAMVGVVFGKGFAFPEQKRHMMRAAYALEALDLVDEA
ncbi:hypothetical protein HDU76_003051, partial [Blyttiomyces sp. JEL0837]